MKFLRYDLCTIDESTGDEIHSPVFMQWSEKNEEIAKQEAHNGEYTIVDDGVEEVYEPTAEDRLAALESAMLEMLGVGTDG